MGTNRRTGLELSRFLHWVSSSLYTTPVPKYLCFQALAGKLDIQPVLHRDDRMLSNPVLQLCWSLFSHQGKASVSNGALAIKNSQNTFRLLLLTQRQALSTILVNLTAIMLLGLVWFLVFQDRVSPSNAGYPETHSVVQASLKLSKISSGRRGLHGKLWREHRRGVGFCYDYAKVSSRPWALLMDMI